MDSPPQGSGLMGSVRRVMDGLLVILQTRAELFSVELREETHRVIVLLVLAGCVLALGFVGLITLTAAVILFCPPCAQPWAALVLGVAYLAASWVIGKRVQGQLKNGPRPFEESLNQLRKDRECLQNRE